MTTKNILWDERNDLVCCPPDYDLAEGQYPVAVFLGSEVFLEVPFSGKPVIVPVTSIMTKPQARKAVLQTKAMYGFAIVAWQETPAGILLAACGLSALYAPTCQAPAWFE